MRPRNPATTASRSPACFDIVASTVPRGWSARAGREPAGRAAAASTSGIRRSTARTGALCLKDQLADNPSIPHTPPSTLLIYRMDETPTLGSYLRAERERRELTLRTISENTKVSLPLLEGLESDDISRWPGGIFRRAFVRSYAEAVGLDPDDVFRRFEQQYKPPVPEGADGRLGAAELSAFDQAHARRAGGSWNALAPSRARYLGTAADLMVAAILAFGCAAAGFAAPLAGAAHRRLLRGRRHADRHEPDGRAPRSVGRARPRRRGDAR